MTNDVHPSRSDLVDFSLGRADDVRSTSVEEHLVHCQACTSWLSENEFSDDLADLIKSVGTASTDVISTSIDPEARIHAYNKDVASVTQFERFGRFDVVRELGRGGMGIVFEAIDSQLRRAVALKVLLSSGSARQRERLRREAEAVAKLNHPGIVQVFEVGECNGYPFIALEMANGGSLAHLMKQRRFSPREAASLTRQIADALAEVHSASIVHRDLKPANVLVVDRPDLSTSDQACAAEDRTFAEEEKNLPVLKLTDFGVAMFADSDEQMTRTGMIVGTLGYMSPEQAGAERDSVGASSDIYSVGVMLYEMLTGQPPFQGGSTIGLLHAIRNDLPTPPRKVVPAIPPDLDTICMTCLEKESSRRYRSASALRDDIERFMRREPIVAKPPGAFARVMHWARRRPSLAFILLVSLLCFGLHSLMLATGGNPESGIDHRKYHWPLVSLLVGYATLASLVDSQRRRHPEQSFWAYLTLFVSLVFPTIGFAFDAGPRSAPIPLLATAAPFSMFLQTNVFMIWMSTGMAAFAYLSLVVYAAITAPQLNETAESIVAFLMTLVVIATVLHLQIRRLQLS